MVVALGSPPPPAAQAHPAPGHDPCPAAFPVEALHNGQALTGLTVEQGTEPESFKAEVLGVLNDGIAPGVDMIMVEVSSQAVDRYGVWAGMSGSPVYSADGRLVGAVAYGLAFGASPVAGVTPAAAMQELLDEPVSPPLTAGPADPAQLTRPLAAAISDRGLATVAAIEAGVTALPVPLGVSGASPARVRAVADRLDLGLDLRLLHRVGSASADAPTPSPVPGGNAAVAMSIGDFSVVATGTVTAVCGDEVLVFGHPMNYDGVTTMGLHGAEALLVQEDLLVSFKLANPLGQLGTVTQDRLAGLRATTAELPDAIPVTSTFTNAESGFTRTGTTQVLTPDAALDLAAYHLLVTAGRVVDEWGDGQASMDWVAAGTTGTGERWRVRRSDAVSSSWDVSWEVGALVYDRLGPLLAAPDTEAMLRRVTVTGTLDEDFDRLRLRGLEVRSRGSWQEATPDVVVTEGRPMKVRLTAQHWRSADISRQVLVLDAPRRSGRWAIRASTARGWCETCNEGDFAQRLSSLRQVQSADSVDVVASRSGVRPREGLAVFATVVTGRLRGAVTVR